MKKRNNKFTRLSIAVLFALALTAACSHVKTAQEAGQANNSVPSEAVALINAKPEVVWSANPQENRLYEKKFLIPDDYFEQKNFGNHHSGSLGTVFVATPDLKPLSDTKKECRFAHQRRLSCFSGNLEIITGVDLNRQDYKDAGKNINNVLNDMKKDPKGGLGTLKWDHYLPIQEGVYGFDEAYLIDLPAAKQEVKENNDMGYELSGRKDAFYKFDKQKNVLTHVRCLAKDIPHGYLYKNGLLHGRCEHMFVVKSLNREIHLAYDREYLPQWQKLQDSALNLINQFNQAAMNGAK